MNLFGVPATGVSNYYLFEAPGGLCTQVASCAFEGCLGPFVDLLGRFSFHYQSEALDPNAPVITREEVADFSNDERFNLQAATVHVQNAGDVSAAIKYATENEIGLSVKTSGHNWMGASVKKDTLNLNLSKLKKYALPELSNEAITECAEDPSLTGAIGDACKLASARGKNAVIRVGGGQVRNRFRLCSMWNLCNHISHLFILFYVYCTS